MDQYLQKNSTYPSLEIEARIACSMSCAFMYRQLHRKDIDQWFERAYLLAQCTENPQLILQIGFSYTYFAIWTGQHTKANIILDYLKLFKDVFANSPSEALFAFGERKKAEQHLQETLNCYRPNSYCVLEGI